MIFWSIVLFYLLVAVDGPKWMALLILFGALIMHDYK